MDQYLHTHVIHPDDVALAVENMQRCLEQPAQVHELTLRKYDVEGTLIYTRWMALGVPKNDDGQTEIFCIGYEISPLNVEAELLEHATQKLKAIMNSSFDQSILVTKTGVVLGFNKTALEQMRLHLNVHLVAGLRLLDEIAHTPLCQQMKVAIDQAAVGRSYSAEFQFPVDGQGLLWFRAEVMPVYDGDSAVTSISIIISNIDALKKSQLHLAHQNAHLMEIAQMQSHHIRRPVANIKGLLHLMKMEDMNQEVRQYVQLLEESAEEADEVIREVVAKTISGRAVPD
jgi:PAS domain-containing protein